MTRSSAAIALAVLLTISAGLAIVMKDGAQARTVHMCPMIYRPVCAADRFGHTHTFSNRCMAQNAGARVRHEGACHRRH